MKLNIPSLGSLFPLVDSHVSATLEIDGKSYEIEHFHIGFSQEVDHKGQPQHETKGGQLLITLTQSVEFSIIDWAKRTGRHKDGRICFKTESSGTVLDIKFFRASCIGLKTRVSSTEGLRTELILAPEKLSLNGLTHDNQWRS
ncbi:type VI secretion system tube protein TssD [Dysgonomonas sp. HGC4]|uniref:type VI secretion system tube protein TssD n=1 Tax=Dysgonomonas sp. HGC4 TaxID=1658009 RepID=UPI0006818D30|nr:type VI secretion system tube protein TssD [Dysgonomonas sp. HGC4]MBD8347044.1 hypothetical protein [Dysgonomonas sp. HGC4]